MWIWLRESGNARLTQPFPTDRISHVLIVTILRIHLNYYTQCDENTMGSINEFLQSETRYPVAATCYKTLSDVN